MKLSCHLQRSDLTTEHMMFFILVQIDIPFSQLPHLSLRMAILISHHDLDCQVSRKRVIAIFSSRYHDHPQALHFIEWLSVQFITRKDTKAAKRLCTLQCAEM